MIKIILKIILVPILFILSPIELIYHISIWLFTEKDLPDPIWWRILNGDIKW